MVWESGTGAEEAVRVRGWEQNVTRPGQRHLCSLPVTNVLWANRKLCEGTGYWIDKTVRVGRTPGG